MKTTYEEAKELLGRIARTYSVRDRVTRKHLGYIVDPFVECCLITEDIG